MKALTLIVLLMLASPGGAATAPDSLYTGEVPVVDQGDGERRRAVPLALRQVLLKLSGLRGFEDFPLVEPALEQAPALLLSYFYRNVDRVLADGGEAQELRLVARFAAADVDDMVRRLQLPVWRPKRPPLVAWLIIDDGLERRLMPVEYGYARQAMENVAAQRGLPLSWPVPDAEGGYGVDLQLLWGGYTEDLVAGADRGSLIVAARREGAEWGVRFNLGYRELQTAWRVNEIDLPAALEAGMQRAVDEIAAANTIAAADLGNWVQDLTVNGLRGADDYRRCLNYLQGISMVGAVEIISARPGSVTFRLGLTALPRYLEEALAAGAVLERQDEENVYTLAEEGADGS